MTIPTSKLHGIGYCPNCHRVYLAQDCAMQARGYQFITEFKDQPHLMALYLIGGWDAVISALAAE